MGKVADKFHLKRRTVSRETEPAQFVCDAVDEKETLAPIFVGNFAAEFLLDYSRPGFRHIKDSDEIHARRAIASEFAVDARVLRAEVADADDGEFEFGSFCNHRPCSCERERADVHSLTLVATRTPHLRPKSF